jgi:hypothetical protein
MKAVLLALALSTDALIAPQRSFGGARRAAKSSAVTMSASKKILVLGGDGFCGWPTALHLSDKGHDARRRRPKRRAKKRAPRARARRRGETEPRR